MFKRAVKDFLWFWNGVFVGAILTIGCLWFAAEYVMAATYNVYFNNVEQGPGSTASPSLNITGGKPAPASVTAPTPAEVEAPQAPVVEAPVIPTDTQVASSTASVESPRPFKKGRLALRAHSLDQNVEFNQGKAGASVGASYFFDRSFGLSVTAGVGEKRTSYYGAELEIVPIHLSLFDWSDTFEAGFVVGASTLGRSQALDIPGTVHAGLTAMLNMGPRYGFTAGLRSNLTDRGRGVKYVMADAGILMRF